MDERIHVELQQAVEQLRRAPASLPPDRRRKLVSMLAEMLQCGDGGSLAGETAELLAGDPDWAVRLDVAKMVHLLDDERFARVAAQLRADCNSYVRSHAQRSLERQRKARQTATRKHGECRSYGERIDQLARQHGPGLAHKIQSLADQRYALLTAAVAHDVRGILTTLSANAAALADEHGRTGRFASILQDIDFLKRTIEGMEQFSKAPPMQRLPEDVHEIIHQAVDKARHALAQQGHDLAAVNVVVASTPRVQLRLCRQLIVLALTNIIQNALESFSSRDVDALRPGRIDIDVTVDGYEARIQVKDDGPGIEPEVLRELVAFVPTGLNKAKRCSSGWGLSLVHKYVIAHGGTVAISSETDRGTTVVIVLPMRDFVEGEDE